MNDSPIITPDPPSVSEVPEYEPELLEKMARENLANTQQAAAHIRKMNLGKVDVGTLLALSGAASQAISALAMTRIHGVLNGAVELASMLQKED